MDDSSKFEKLIEDCSGIMVFKGGGSYVCEDCGYEFLTEFGRLKRYIYENGPKNAFELSIATGVSRKTIQEYVRDGRLEAVAETATYELQPHLGEPGGEEPA